MPALENDLLDIFALDSEIARLEMLLPQEAGLARAALLVALAWHLRQRDTRRAIDLADQAEAQLAYLNLPQRQEKILRARLELIRAEAQWLFGNTDAAQSLLDSAMPILHQIDDASGLADAHFLRSKLATDFGDSNRESLELLLALDFAKQSRDPLRIELMQGTLAYAEILVDFQQGTARWRQRYLEEPLAAHPLVISSFNDFKGAHAWLAGDFGRAATYFIRAHQAALQCGQMRRAMYISNNVGDAFDSLNDHQTALNWMLQGLDMARQSGWPATIGACLTQTAQVMRHLGRLETAQQMLDEAMYTMQAFAGSRNHTIALEYLAELEIDRGNFESALERFRQLHEQATRLGQSDFFTTTWRGKAHALSELGFANEALHAANMALQVAHQYGDQYHQISALQVLAQIYQRHQLPLPSDGASVQEAPSSALYFLLQAYEIAQHIDGYTVSSKLLDAIADAWAELGEFERAYQLARLANVAREKTHGQQATNRAIALQIQQQTEQTQAVGEYHRHLAEAEARRAQTLQETSAILEHMSAIGQEITVHLDSDAVFQALYRHVQQLLDVNSFAIYLLTDDGLAIRRAFGMEAGNFLPSGQIFLDSPTAVSARCIRERREILIDNPSFAPLANHIPGTQLSRCSLFAPLMVAERIMGVMTVQSIQRHAYAEREQLIFRTLCAYGAIALDNANAYSQLKQAQSQLVAQEKLAALGSLVAGVAHELNTPVGNSIMMASALQVHTQEIQAQLDNRSLRHSTLQTFVNEAQEAAQVILRGLGSAADLVSSFKQVAVDRTTAQQRVFDLQQTCHEIVATMMNQIRPTGHEIVLEIAEGIEMDSFPGPLGQVITHLINNSLVHGFDGRSAGCMHLRAQIINAERVQLQFRDNGVGIAAKHLKFVFDPFFTTKMGRGGSGLGLSISYNIVTSLLRGFIAAESQLEQWTVFTLDLPLMVKKEVQSHSPSEIGLAEH